MTPPDELVAAANTLLPDGWRLELTELRHHKFRSKWRIVALKDGERRNHWDTYRVGALLPAIVERIGLEGPVVVTTDEDGFIRSIEDAP